MQAMFTHCKFVVYALFSFVALSVPRLAFSQHWRSEADSLLGAYLRENLPKKQVTFLSKASLVLLFHKPDTALVLSNLALQKALLSGNDTAIVEANLSLSAVYLIKDNTPEVLKYALNALEIANSKPMSNDLMASIYRKLGYVYRYQNLDIKSLNAFRKSLQYSVLSNNLHDISATSSNVGLLFAKIEQPDSALHYHQLALAIAKKANFKDIATRCFLNIMNLYDDQKQYNQAFKTFEAMKPWVHDADVTPIVKGLVYTAIADLDLRKGSAKHVLAKQYLDSMAILMQTTDPGTENKVDYYLSRSLYEFSQGHSQAATQALVAFQKFKSIRDKEILEGHSQDLAVKYETGKKEEQIKLLAKQNKLRQWLAIVFLTSTLLFLGFLIWIGLQNQKIKKQELKLNFLMKELHHRVKNNLQIVSSLLSLQSNQVADQTAQKALFEGQLRIESMSLIHRKLYQTNDVSGVDMKAFTTELSENLMHAYGFNNHNFKLITHIETDVLDADTAIPMGLIMNEVITNAFKYAYVTTADPLLNIDLSLSESELVLTIQDNGTGLTQQQWDASFSFGKQLILSLLKQIKGTFNLVTTTGTCFIFTIPYQKR